MSKTKMLVALVLASALAGCMHRGGGASRPSKAICPVSGESVKVRDGTPTMTWKGRQLYFASEAHLKRFAEAPESFKTREHVPPSGAH